VWPHPPFRLKIFFLFVRQIRRRNVGGGQGTALATVVSDSSTVVSGSGKMVWMDVGEDLIPDVVVGFAKYYVGYFLLPFRLFFSSFKSWVVRELVCYVRVHLSIYQYFFFKIFCYTLVLELEMSSILFP